MSSSELPPEGLTAIEKMMGAELPAFDVTKPGKEAAQILGGAVQVIYRLFSRIGDDHERVVTRNTLLDMLQDEFLNQVVGDFATASVLQQRLDAAEHIDQDAVEAAERALSEFLETSKNDTEALIEKYYDRRHRELVRHAG